MVDKRRKSPARRQRTNTADIGLVAVPAGAPAVPTPAKEWLVATRQRWNQLWRSEIAGVLELDSDLPALRRLFDYYDEKERASRGFRKQRFVKGSQGQPVLNPLGRYGAGLEPAIRALEDRFGLTPLARLRLGVEFGNAHRSLEELNRLADQAEDDHEDPRLEIIEGAAKRKR